MSSSSKIYRVLNSSPKGHQKTISVQSTEGSGASISLKLHRFALVGKGDQIRLGTAGNSRISVVPKSTNEPDIPVTPRFTRNDYVLIGKEKYELRIQEISSISDLHALEFLEQFHYKSNSAIGVKDTGDNAKALARPVSGRRAVLYVSIKLGECWTPAGYIDLQMPVMMCKPRHNLFRYPFDHPTRDISWDTWNTQAMKNHLNTIVRIGRIVVSPELRGLGLTRRIIKAAKIFAVERWHIGGIRPIFMEILAEMLNYIDFVSSSDFKYIGHTEGNISRIIKDMEQMSRDPNGEFGIMTLQRKYFRVLDDYCKTLEISIEEGLEILRKKIEQNQDALTTGEWAMLRSLIRNPIPYFLCSLDDYTTNYLHEALNSYSSDPIAKTTKQKFSVRSVFISIKEMSIRASYSIPKTKSTQIIMDSFGLEGDTVYSDIVQNISLTASNGNIILIVGASGSGKSVLLNALDPKKALSGNIKVKNFPNLKYTAGRLKRLRDDVPVFEALAEKFTPERSFIALSRVGLSEALVFIKPFWMLSRGQQYRAMIADLLLRDEEVWILDEFCSDLDPITAKIVAHNLRKQIIATRRIAIIAAANHAHYMDALRPTRILLLRSGDYPTWLSFKEYKNEFFGQII